MKGCIYYNLGTCSNPNSTFYKRTCQGKHGLNICKFLTPSKADKLREISDEELATIIFTEVVCAERAFKTESELFDWLKQEAGK